MRQLEIIGDAGAAVVGGTALGRDEHDTVTGLRAVDGSGGGILQHLHAGDHGRVEIADIIHLETVHDEEGADVAGVGGVAADTDGRRGTRRAGTINDVDTGSLALQGGGGVGSGAVLELLLTNGGNGAGEVALLLDAIADNDRFFQEFCIFLQNYLIIGLAADDKILGSITDAGYGKR